MPEKIPARGGGQHGQPRSSGFRASVVIIAGMTFSTFALAQDRLSNGASSLDSYYFAALLRLERQEIATLALTFGLLCFAVLTAVMLVRTRRRASQRDAKARDEIVRLRAEIDRAHALILSDPQMIISWGAASDEPDIVGSTAIAGSTTARRRVLAFGTWLEPVSARNMENAVEALRATGESFTSTLTTTDGIPVEAEGRIVGGRAVLRLRDVSGAKRELADLTANFRRLHDDLDALRTLIDAIPAPVWVRDDLDRLVFANAAYARAVEAHDGANVIERGLELFDRAARVELAKAQVAGKSFEGRLPAIVAGQRRSFDVLTMPTAKGNVGIGIDATDAEAMRAELGRMVDAHRRTLDQLATGVAIFDSNQRLSFYNTAYRSLWDLDAGFLDQGPTDSTVLDRLRTARRLPEQQDFRQWKSELHEAYRAPDAKSYEWHLPDGRTMRVVTTPNPEGGVIYLFDDITERQDLERRFNALIRVQRETLDNLSEAVAVFASDGRLDLFNPSFAHIWRLNPEQLMDRPHVEAVIGWCQRLYSDQAIWQQLRAAVTSIDAREPVIGRLERRDGSVVDCATLPLPDGATLVAFHDVTDTVNVERALRERNEALEAADEIKVDFVHHVSYELRSPLTNIIGFAELLGDPSTGPLNDRQREYLGYITASTTALLAIINNILDLATIDAGEMTLELSEVDIRRTMEAASEGVKDRLVKDNIKLDLRVAANIGSFVADERRVRQVLFNLLANAVGFSPAGETITLSAERSPEAITFSVTDRGPGIPTEVMEKVFDWFETHSLGSRHRGTGLGLSLVRSFVELHGGGVTIDSAVGHGTTVTCTFPLDQAARRTAA